jgi:pimeloyl-ACP methyl ester carboxylesterase
LCDEAERLLLAVAATLDCSADVKKLTMPVILIYGDSDTFRPEHIVKFYQLLGGGLKDAGWHREHMSQNRLAISPNITHYEMGFAPQLVDTALPFLDGQSRAKSWDEQVSAK